MSPTKGSARRRIGVVEDHTDLVVASLQRILEPYSHLEVVAGAKTVADLLAITAELDLVVLDLHHLPDESSPAQNVAALRAAGIHNVLAYTYGGSRALVREAAKAGVLGIVPKNESRDAVVEAIAMTAEGEMAPSMDWAAALDSDEALIPELTPREKQVLALYASGERAQDVADLLGVQTSTVYAHVKKIKEKYAAVGRPAQSKAILRRHAQRDGLAPGSWQ
ncbi:LuxR C-terminal-related transcriptional regulator [Nocardia sp. NPDC057030]|uniref:LuxR C-terminal-related transcriptional regulator n=1 Tax=unclassified Nocardia TaxID=2637762 RepID=UPI003633BC27